MCCEDGSIDCWWEIWLCGLGQVTRGCAAFPDPPPLNAGSLWSHRPEFPCLRWSYGACTLSRSLFSADLCVLSTGLQTLGGWAVWWLLYLVNVNAPPPHPARGSPWSTLAGSGQISCYSVAGSWQIFVNYFFLHVQKVTSGCASKDTVKSVKSNPQHRRKYLKIICLIRV